MRAEKAGNKFDLDIVASAEEMGEPGWKGGRAILLQLIVGLCPGDSVSHGRRYVNSN